MICKFVHYFVAAIGILLAGCVSQVRPIDTLEDTFYTYRLERNQNYSIDVPKLAGYQTIRIEEIRDGLLINTLSTTELSKNFTHSMPGAYQYKFYGVSKNSADVDLLGESLIFLLPENYTEKTNIAEYDGVLQQPFDVNIDPSGRLVATLNLELIGGLESIKPNLTLFYAGPRPDHNGVSTRISAVPKVSIYPSLLRHGWNVSVASVIHRCRIDESEFCLDDELLRKTSGLATDVLLDRDASLYEGDFLRSILSREIRVQAMRDANGALFFESKQNGYTLRYGMDDSAQAISAEGRIDHWFLQEAEDEFGNIRKISYGKISNSAIPYPLAIEYGDHRVVFEYGFRYLEQTGGGVQPIAGALYGTDIFVTPSEVSQFNQSWQQYLSRLDSETGRLRSRLIPLQLQSLSNYYGDQLLRTYHFESEIKDGFERLAAVSLCGYDKQNEKSCVKVADIDWQAASTIVEDYSPDDDVNRYKIGLKSIAQNFSQTLDFEYKQNLSTTSAVDPSMQALLGWREERAFQQRPGRACASCNIATEFTWVITKVNSSALSSPITEYSHTIDDSPGSAVAYRLPDGSYLYQAYLLSSSKFEYKDRLIREELYSHPYGSPLARLLQHKEQQWAAINSGVVNYNYIEREKNFLVDDTGSPVGATFTDSTITWNEELQLPDKIVESAVTGYGFNEGEISRIERQVDSTSIYSHEVSPMVWDVEFPKIEQADYDKRVPGRSGELALRNTNFKLPGRGGNKKSKTVLTRVVGESENVVQTVDMRYDDKGNLISEQTVGKNINDTTIAYGDFVEGIYPGFYRIKKAGSRAEFYRYQYDTRLGLVSETLNDNNQTERTEYDFFGRPRIEEKADGSRVFYQWEDCRTSCPSIFGVQPQLKIVAETRVGEELRTTDIDYIDAFGRVLRTETIEDNKATNIQDYAYDVSGRVVRFSQAYNGAMDPKSVAYGSKTYDLLGRLVAETLFNGDRKKITYDQQPDGLIVITELIQPSDQISDRQRQKYNSAGQLVEEYKRFNLRNERLIRYSYGPLGNQTVDYDSGAGP